LAKLPSSPFVYPITDRRLAGDIAIGPIVEALCRGGVKLIQLREKGLTTRRHLEIARAAVTAAHVAGAKLLINDRVDIALLSGADGVHLGDDDLPPADARRILGADLIIGVSCHGLDDVRSALDLPIDYLAVGPVFPTDTKTLRYPVVGLELVRHAKDLTALPLVAIGGITRSNAAQVVAAGADGVAVISELMAPGEIKNRTRELIDSVATP
jgi:thiamine-phosphate pyrophosphorylase